MADTKHEAFINYPGRIPSVREAREDIKEFIEEHRSTPGTWTLRLYFGPLKKNCYDKINELAARISLPPCSWYSTSFDSDRIVLKVFITPKR